MDHFFSWQMLATFTGASFATALITQFCDRLLNRRKKLPTQAVSYLAALVILLLAQSFTGGLTLDEGFLCVFNALLVSSATSGTISGVRRMMQ